MAPARLAGQDRPSPRAAARELFLERKFGPDSAEQTVVTLERHVVYWVELIGPGTPEFVPVRRRPRPAFIVPIGEETGAEPRGFEVYPAQDGSHLVTLTSLPPGTTTILRMYRDVIETRRIAEKLDTRAGLGLSVGGGFHTGYRVDSTGGANPRGGSDAEACLLLEAGDLFGTCLGAETQSFPDAPYAVTWLFIEQRVRALTRGIAGRRADSGVAVRYSQGLSAGPQHLNPRLLGAGLYLRYHLDSEGRRRGMSLFIAWQHARLSHAPETERLDTDRLTVGITWMP